ncbi:MAG: hypothetical protein WBE39_14515 [Candidatus Competibacter sp.]
MTVRFHRKQIVVSVLAAILAAASFWIPIAHKTAPLDQTTDLSASGKGGKQIAKSEG